MPLPTILFVVALSTISVSCGWAMRGTILGGERGAMLPGAMLGLILAWSSGSDIVRENFWLLAAVGACSIFFGGAQTYGQTLGMSHDLENRSRRMKGRVGVTVKGATWFALAGGFLGMSYGAMAGIYKISDIVLLVVLLSAFKWIGFLVLNSPQKPKQGKFPKLYFSEGRFEIWGGLVFMVVELIIFQLVRSDWFSLKMTLAGLVGGGAGFLIGNLFQTGTSHKNKKGKYHIFGSLYEKGYIGSWKMMEYTLGAVGGLALSLCFCLSYGQIEQYNLIIEQNGIWSPMGDRADIFAYVWVGILVLHALTHLVPEPKPYKKDIEAKFKSGEISEERYNELLETASDQPAPKAFKRVADLAEQSIWLVFAYIPLLLSLLGGLKAARLCVVSMMLWILVEEIVFSKYMERFAHRGFVKCFSIIVSAALLAVQLIADPQFSMLAVWIFLCLSYELAQCFIMFNPKQVRLHKAEHKGFKNFILGYKSGLTVRLCAWIFTVFMLVCGIVQF